MRRKIKRLRGGGMDASKSDFKTPSGNTGVGGQSPRTGPGNKVQAGGSPPSQRDNRKTTNIPTVNKKKKISPFSVTNEPLDTPYKSNLLLNLAAGIAFPGGGFLMEGAQRRGYKKRQEFAREQGLYRDFYRTEGKPFQPNNPANRKYMKDAGFGKRPKEDTRDDRGPQLCPDGTLPPCVKPKPAADPAKPKTIQPQKFNFEFSQGGLSGGKRFGPPPKKGPRSHGICPHRPDGIRGVGAVEKGRGVKFVGVK